MTKIKLSMKSVMRENARLVKALMTANDRIMDLEKTLEACELALRRDTPK